MSDVQDGREWKVMINHQHHPIITVSGVLRINPILGLAVKNQFDIWTGQGTDISSTLEQKFK